MMRELTGWLCRIGCGIRDHLRQVARWVPTLAVVLAGLAATPVKADLYHYTYTGNLFTMTAQVPDWPLNDPTQGRTFMLEAISAEFYTAAPLVAGTTLADVTGFSMTISPWYGAPWTLTAPLEVPPCPGCPPVTVAGSLTIGAVSDFGLPGLWDFWISYDTTFPTGRHQRLTLASTQNLDSVTGGYEGFVSYSGGLTASPGVWAVAMVVPEPASVILFAVGILIVVWFVRRQRSDR